MPLSALPTKLGSNTGHGSERHVNLALGVFIGLIKKKLSIFLKRAA